MYKPPFMQRLTREKALSRYLSALEKGDMDTVIAVLELSAQDAELEKMIFTLHESYATEEEFLAVLQEEHGMEFDNNDSSSKIIEQIGSTETTHQPETLHKRDSKFVLWQKTLAAVLVMAFIVASVL